MIISVVGYRFTRRVRDKNADRNCGLSASVDNDAGLLDRVIWQLTTNRYTGYFFMVSYTVVTSYTMKLCRLNWCKVMQRLREWTISLTGSGGPAHDGKRTNQMWQYVANIEIETFAIHTYYKVTLDRRKTFWLRIGWILSLMTFDGLCLILTGQLRIDRRQS